MDLKEFIKQSLVQIVTGTAEAQEEVDKHGAAVNPCGLLRGGGVPSGHAKTTEGNFTQNIEFDVAVTSNEGTGSKGGIGVVVGAIALGTQANSSQSTQAISRIRFTIPMLLPATQLPDAEELRKRRDENTRRLASNRNWRQA